MSDSRITPYVFISAASDDLSSARQIVKDALLTIGCHPIVQEHFQPDYQDVRQMLKSRMDGCHAVIHLVGSRYGGEPDTKSLSPGLPRRSWTQMEYDLAKEMGLKLYLFVFDESYPFDVQELPEPADEVALQEAHRDSILRGEQFYSYIKTPEELELRISEMKLEAAELREFAKKSSRRLFTTLGIVGALLALILTILAFVKKDTSNLHQGQKTILSNIDDIRESFAGLNVGGAIIANPSSPEEYYHNARISELKGDYSNARKAYLEYFKFDIELLDPHLRFQQFLKVQEGLEGARETYKAITANSPGIVPRLASAMLWNRENRINKLDAFIQSNPKFGPAYYLLSKDFSASSVANHSLEDKRREKQLLETFESLDANGEVVKWLLDQSLVSEWRDDAAERMRALERSKEVIKNPVHVTWMSHNGGWSGNVQVGEPAAEIFWKPPGAAEFVSTGFSTARSVTTGQVMPMPTIQLPSDAGRMQLEVKYRNLNGDEMGPFTAEFDPVSQSLSQSKMILRQTSTSWLSYRDYDGKTLLYFTHLLTHRNTISKITYGIDKEVPDTDFPFPAYSKPGVAPIGSDVNTYIEVPADTQFVTVQITYLDGEKTSIQTFRKQ
ncbi:MAG: DUF4062 domain-containing protein [Verrucomicrobiales bacterium]|nr:DUF4062 domain-containing protein [Verrucomicrobiales bacterium]